MCDLVMELQAAPSEVAVKQFDADFNFEPDFWDTYHALQSGNPGLTLLDVRGPAPFEVRHAAGAITVAEGKIVAAKFAGYVPGTLFATHCAGPHCNGAARGALRLARLGYPVKITARGVRDWLDEVFPLESGPRRRSSSAEPLTSPRT